MSLFNKDKSNDQESSKPEQQAQNRLPIANQGNAEMTPEQAAGERLSGVEQKKSPEQIDAEASHIRAASAEFVDNKSEEDLTDDDLDENGDRLGLSRGDAGSSPNSPSSIAARSPQAPRDKNGRYKKAVPDASGVSINGRPAHEHQHLLGHHGAANPVYETSSPAAQVHQETPLEKRQRRLGLAQEQGTTNKQVDNSPEVAKPQQVKDDQARRAS